MGERSFTGRVRKVARFTRQNGFTLAELLIVAAILAMVAAAIVGVYTVSQQTYTRATSLEDAQLGARAGVDRMAGELRLIGAYWTDAILAGPAITAATPTSITFLADVNADSVYNGAEMAVNNNPNSTTVGLSGNPTEVADSFNVYGNPALNDFASIADGVTREVRQLAAVSGSNLTLATGLTQDYSAGGYFVRSVETVAYNFDGATNTLTRSVGGSGAQTIVENATALTLTYFDVNGAITTDPDLIREIEISLTTQGNDGSSRTMTSRVRPRNLPLDF